MKGHWDPPGEVREAPASLEVVAAEVATDESALLRDRSERAPWGRYDFAVQDDEWRVTRIDLELKVEVTLSSKMAELATLLDPGGSMITSISPSPPRKREGSGRSCRAP